MLHSEIIAVCSDTHTNHINTLCGHNVEFVNVNSGGTYSNRCALKSFTKRPTKYSALSSSRGIL